jgi:predicted P-loop ATPase
MVARIFIPGCKQDHMMILEGGEGLQKSSFLRALADPWFSDSRIDLKSMKDAYQSLPGKWVIEIPEMDSFNQAGVETVQGFVASQEDDYRASYARRNKKHKRHCLFTGTTNHDQYFRGDSNRRMWPLRVHAVYLEGLLANRNQLFAEAVVLFRAGEPWYPTKEQELEHFKVQQEERELTDPWFGIIRNWLAKETIPKFSVADILIGCLGFEVSRIGEFRNESKRLGKIMKKLGWKRERESSGLVRDWYYQRPVKAEIDKDAKTEKF